MPISFRRQADSPAVDDVAAVPVVEKGKPRYAHYLSLPKPKAFVVTEKGGWYFASGNEEAMRMAPRYVPRRDEMLALCRG